MVSSSKFDESVAIDTGTSMCTDFYRAEGYHSQCSVGYLMRRIISMLSHEIERELEPTGLTNAQWVPLVKMHLGKASTVAELARECDLDAGSMTRLLDRLEAKQLCRRVRSTDDRRVVNMELTDAGRSAAQGIPVVLSRVQNAYLAGFTHDEWHTLQGFLQRIHNSAHTLQTAQTAQTAQTVQTFQSSTAADNPDSPTSPISPTSPTLSKSPKSPAPPQLAP